MDRKKIDNIIIIILLLLNLFLLSVTAADRIQRRRADRETVKTATELLAANGIRLGEDAVLLQETPALCTVVRDLAAERGRMKVLLGSVAPEDLGGSILFYRTPQGQAVLRGTGEIDILFSGDSVPVKGSPEKTVVRLLGSAGVELAPMDTGGASAGGYTEYCCLWNGMPVYNARMIFDVSGSNLSMASGTLVLNKETERSTESVMDAVSVLMRFLEIVRSEGFICSCLESITPGYLMSVTVSGESTLSPVWHIETDTGELYINAISGKTETVL